MFRQETARPPDPFEARARGGAPACARAAERAARPAAGTGARAARARRLARRSRACAGGVATRGAAARPGEAQTKARRPRSALALRAGRQDRSPRTRRQSPSEYSSSAALLLGFVDHVAEPLALLAREPGTLELQQRSHGAFDRAAEERAQEPLQSPAPGADR